MEATKPSLALIFALVSGLSFGAENCFLHSYVNNRPVASREVSFQVPPMNVTVTRVLATQVTSPRLKELVAFADKNNVVMIREGKPPLASEATTYLTVSSEALSSEKTLADFMEKSLVDFYDSPLNLDRLPVDSRKAVMKMKENFRTRFVSATETQGLSYDQQNMIAIKARHVENLRVNAVVNHEITHQTTDRKIFEALNPTPGTPLQKLTEALAGRELRMKAKTSKTMTLPGPILDYKKFYRSDEIEATLREMARGKKDGQNLDTAREELYAFMDAQKHQLNQLLKNEGRELKITTDEAVPELGAGRRQRRTVTTDEVNFLTEILVPRDLSAAEERVFIEATLKKRLQTIDSYRQNAEARFPK